MIVTDDDGIRRILDRCRTIAIVGLSPKADRPSNIVARFLLARGYTVVPVNPGQREILGQACFRSLADVPVRVDMVDVFRRAEDVPAIADAAIAIGAKVLWLQLGVIDVQAARRAADAGLDVVMDRCPKIEWRRLYSG